jgi:hypothetical protein
VDERIDSFHPYEEESPESDHLEDKEIEVNDCKMRSLTTDERDDIIRKYNTEHSIHRITPDVVDKSERSDKSVTDSGYSTDASEDIAPMEKLRHLLDELAEVGSIIVKKDMRFLDRNQLDALMTVGQKFLMSFKGSIVAEKARKGFKEVGTPETGGLE